MRIPRRTLVLFPLLLTAARADARKVPLSPEQLLAESNLIVVGRVEGRTEEDRESPDGSVTRVVTVSVKVEAVEKGDAKPGDVVKCLCWVVVREPHDGIVWDAGTGVPGDGGRLRFFLTEQRGDARPVIYPNGLERLDATPFVRYEREKARPKPLPASTETPWLLVFGGAVLLAAIGGAVAFVALRKALRSGTDPASP